MSSTNFTSASEVAAEIKARLATIRTDDDFETDIGAAVYQGRLNIDDDMVPCASVIEGDDRVQNGPSRKIVTAHILQQYALVGYAECDPNEPNLTAHKIIRDVKRVLFNTAGQADATWGGKVREVRYRGRLIGPRADGKGIVMAVVEIEVEYAENLAAP